MHNDFFAYVEHLEMLAFFSGYPLMYYLVRFFFSKKYSKNLRLAGIVTILPYSYALMGTLYLGLLLRNMYPNYSIENIQHRIQQPYLVIWGLISILFWIPAVARRQILTVLHSLVFFFYIVRDLFLQVAGINHDQNIIKNDMKIYTVSIFLNLLAIVLIAFVYFLRPGPNKHSNT